MDTRVPVTVLTGFLGSGKTTLLNRILSESHGMRIAVIENEFGEVGIDNELVEREEEELFEMNNGCICCTVRGDLIRILMRLTEQDRKLDGVIIETTGLADPGPVAQTFFNVAEVANSYRLDGIITLVDSKHVSLHIEDSEEVQKQLAFADVVLLNKTDLVEVAELDVLEERIRSMNGAARIKRCQNADVPVAELLEVGGFNLDRAMDLDERFLEPEYPFEWGGVFEVDAESVDFVLETGPDPMMDIATFPVSGIDDDAIAGAVDRAVRAFAEEPFGCGDGAVLESRMQAHFRLALETTPARFCLEKSEKAMLALFTEHHPEEFSAKFKLGDQKLSPIWEYEFRPDHEHDEAVSSVGVSFAGEMDGPRLSQWISLLLRVKGADLYRSKGVFSVKGSDMRLVFQGVHMLLDGKYDREWKPDEKRENKFVFIGRNLNREELVNGFMSCLA